MDSGLTPVAHTLWAYMEKDLDAFCSTMFSSWQIGGWGRLPEKT